METIILKTDLQCKTCVRTVEPILQKESAIVNYKINLEHPDKQVILEADNLDVKSLISSFKKVGFKAEKLVK